MKPEGGKQAILSSTLGSLIWEKPTSAEFNQLVKYISDNFLNINNIYYLLLNTFGGYRADQRFNYMYEW